MNLFLLRALLCWLVSFLFPTPAWNEKKDLQFFWPINSHFFIASPGILGGILKYDGERAWNSWLKWDLGIFWLSIIIKFPGPYFYVQLANALHEFFCFLSSQSTRNDVWWCSNILGQCKPQKRASAGASLNWVQIPTLPLCHSHHLYDLKHVN